MTPKATAPAVEFPVDSFKDAAPHLRRPFSPDALRFKVQAAWPKADPTAGLVVAYIDARLVVDRLNLIVPHLWTAEYESVGTNAMWCHLTIGEITRRDVGQGTGKGLVSDSLKRAAVHFGIGVSLYAIPKMFLDANSGTVKQKKTKDGLTLEITPSGDTLLRSTYEHWLEARGAHAFGDALDHGDAPGGQGDPHEPEEADEPAAPSAGEVVGPEAIGEADHAPAPPRRPVPAAPRVTTGNASLIRVRARQAGLDDDQLAALVTDHGAESIEDLSRAGADHLLDTLTDMETAAA